MPIRHYWTTPARSPWPEYQGHVISRGSYADTTDDRSDRWYVTPIDSDTWDRRGRGYRLLRIAKAAIDDPGHDYTED